MRKQESQDQCCIFRKLLQFPWSRLSLLSFSCTNVFSSFRNSNYFGRAGEANCNLGERRRAPTYGSHCNTTYSCKLKQHFSSTTVYFFGCILVFTTQDDLKWEQERGPETKSKIYSSQLLAKEPAGFFKASIEWSQPPRTNLINLY